MAPPSRSDTGRLRDGPCQTPSGLDLSRRWHVANRRLSMRKIREVLRLALGAGLELRKIERSLSISHATAARYLAKAKASGLSWPLPDSLDDGALERLFFPKPASSAVSRPLPDWESVRRE